jgi:hypothetical protein
VPTPNNKRAVPSTDPTTPCPKLPTSTSSDHPPASLQSILGEPPVANPKPRTSSAKPQPQPHIAKPKANLCLNTLTSSDQPPASLQSLQGEPPVANPKPRTSSAKPKPQPHVAKPKANPCLNTLTPRKKFVAAKRFFQDLEKPPITILRNHDEHQQSAEHRAEHHQRDHQKPEHHQPLYTDNETSETPSKRLKLNETFAGKIQKKFFDIFK